MLRLLVLSVWCCGSVMVGGCEPVPAKAPSEQRQPLRQVPLGLCEDYPEESRSLDEVRRDLSLLRSAGIDVLRVSIGWDGVEMTKDEYDFAFWDAFVDLAVDEFDVRLIPYVAYTPSWNSDGDVDNSWRTPPRDVTEFAEFMRLLVERYRGRISSWEIWNEPDNRDYWLGTAAQYAELLKAGSKAVRESDPKAQVVFGGLAGGVHFLREVFDQHAGSEHVDVVNLHSYYETWHPDPLETIPEYVSEVSAIVERHGGNQPLWMAEVGYSDFRKAPAAAPGTALGKATFAYEHTPRFQAVMLVRTLALLLAEPAVSLIAWYELKDVRPSDAVIGDDHNRHLGVVAAEYRPKPALDALKFTRRLFSDGFRSIEKDPGYEQTPSPDAHVRSFITANQRVVVVAWLSNAPASSGTTAAVDNDVRQEQARVVVPYIAQSEPLLYDESGRRRTTGLVARSRVDTTELELTLSGGQVSVVEFAAAARR